MSELYTDTEARIEQALEALKRDESPNITFYARQFKVNYERLRRRYQGGNSRSTRHPTNRKLDPAQEDALCDYINRMDHLYLPLTPRLVRTTANAILRLSYVGPLDTAPRVSENWTSRFLERHPEYHKRVSKPLDIERSAAHDVEILEQWFALFKRTMEEYGIQLSDVWNFDETGYNIGMAGETQVITLDAHGKLYNPSSENRTRASSIECINAAGDYLPAFHILPGKCILGNWIDDLQDDDCVAVTDTGYSNDIIGFEWLKKFNEYSARFQKGSWRLLLLDNHDSHCTHDFIEYATSQKIVLLALPAHTTHLMQPLDVTVFQPLKGAYKKALDDALRTGCYNFSKVEFLAAIGRVRRGAFKKSTIMHAWRDTGLIPYDPEVVLSKIRPKKVSTPPLTNDRIEPTAAQTPRTPRSLSRLGTALERRMEQNRPITKHMLARYIRGAQFQAISGAQVKDALRHTQAAEKAREARSKRKNARVQKGGVLRAGDHRRIIRETEESRLLQLEYAKRKAEDELVREQAKRAKKAEKAAKKAETERKRAEREAAKAQKAKN